MTEIDEKGVRVPGWLVGIAAALITAAVAGNFAFVMDTREDVVRLQTEVKSVEAKADKGDSVPAQLATLQTQMTQVQSDVNEIKVSLKRGR